MEKGNSAVPIISTLQLMCRQIGHSFLEYSSRNAANRAVRKLSGKTLCGNVVKLYHRDVCPIFFFLRTVQFCLPIPQQQDYENRKPTTRHCGRSRSPRHDYPSYKYHTSISSGKSYDELPFDIVDPYARDRGRPLYTQRSRASTGTSNTEPSLDQTDPYAYISSRRAARDIPSSSSVTDDYDAFHLRGRYGREWEQHQADVAYYNDPRWGYYT
jgi:hypothetical protein